LMLICQCASLFQKAILPSEPIVRSPFITLNCRLRLSQSTMERELGSMVKMIPSFLAHAFLEPKMVD
jgi:hypothetical protein